MNHNQYRIEIGPHPIRLETAVMTIDGQTTVYLKQGQEVYLGNLELQGEIAQVSLELAACLGKDNQMSLVLERVADAKKAMHLAQVSMRKDHSTHGAEAGKINDIVSLEMMRSFGIMMNDLMKGIRENLNKIFTISRKLLKLGVTKIDSSGTTMSILPEEEINRMQERSVRRIDLIFARVRWSGGEDATTVAREWNFPVDWIVTKHEPLPGDFEMYPAHSQANALPEVTPRCA